MNSLTTLLRQDLFALRWYLPCWFVSLLGAVALGKTSLDLSDPKNMWIGIVVGLALLGSGIGTFGTLLFTHASSDNRAAWHTRPFPRWIVGCEKLTMIGALILLPLVSFMAGSRPDLSGNLTYLDQWKTLAPPMVLMFLTISYVAVVCRTSRTLLLILLALLLFGGFAGTAFIFLRAQYACFTFNEVGGAIARTLYVLGLGGLFVWQYVRPNPLRHMIGGATVFAAIALVSVVLPDPRRSLRVLNNSAYSATFTVLEPAPIESLSRYDPLRERDLPVVPWKAEVRLEGFAPDRLWQARLFLHNIKNYGSRDLERPTAGFFPTTTLLEPLGLSGYTLEGAADPNFVPLNFNVQSESPIRELSPEVEFHVSVERLSAVPVIRFPISVGYHDGQAPGYGIKVIEIDADLNEIELKPTFPDASALNPKTASPRSPRLTLLVVHEATRRAAVIQPKPQTLAELRTNRLERTYRLPAWNVSPSELRIVGMVTQADARVRLPVAAQP